MKKMVLTLSLSILIITLANAADDVIMSTSGTYTVCSAKFYDAGGPSTDYPNNQNVIVTLLPATPGAKVSVTFSSFNTQTHYNEFGNFSVIDDDILFVYNGNSTSANQIGALQGQSGYGTITSTAADGSLTFKFVSHAPYSTPPSGARAGWAATITCNLGSIVYNFEFSQNAQPFIQQAITAKSKSYFYYYINETIMTPVKGTTFSFNLTSGETLIPSGAEYLGNGILKFWIDLRQGEVLSDITVSLPNSITQNGGQYIFKNKPSPFSVQVLNNPINQSIDIFSGGSAGIKLIAGGAGAGPSVAAATLSLTGTGGMGINFNRDSENNELITRRFEAGFGLEVESPAINAVVGDIQAGINVTVMVKGILGQTMSFPNTLNTEIVKEAKAAYILETFAMGGVELSPFAAIFLKALKNTLLNSNPNLSAVYSGLYYSNQTGLSLEGDASVGFSVASGKGAEQTKLVISEYGRSVALTRKHIKNVHDDNQSMEFGYALGYDISALNFEIANIDFGNVFDYKYGIDFSIGANYNPSEGIKSFELSFGATPSSEISFANFSDSYSYDFIIPKKIISKNQYIDNLIGTTAPIFIPGLPNKNFKVGMNYFTENLSDIYMDNPPTLDSFNDHIIMQITKSSTKGLKVDAKIDLDAALGIGAGLRLGIQYAYLDEMTYPKSQYIVAHNQLLPIAEFDNIPTGQRLFSIQDEINDVFEGTVLLIKEQLNELTNVVEKIIESGKNFTISVANNAARLFGNIAQSGAKFIIRSLNPATKTLQKGIFIEPKLISAYSSSRIIHLNNKSAILESEPDGSILYIVSDIINVSLIGSNNQVITSFDPVTLSIGIDNQKLNELGFGQNEKKLAKMYQYDSENLIWLELGRILNNTIDTVSAQITNSATYAVGIELNPIDDISAPNIMEYYPHNGESIGPVTNFWAKLYELPTGVGIDFSQTLIKIDEKEVSAVWNPVNNVISYESIVALSIGQHTFEVIVSDYNGNKNSIKSTVLVNEITSINSLESVFKFECYPVPTNDILNIEINSANSEPISIGIYNQIGQLVSNTFECQPINGYLNVQWDRIGFNSHRVESGIYFVRVKMNNKIMVKKIILK